MRVLLVGSGGREHALAWKIASSPSLEKLWIAPGNPGTSNCGENIPVDATNIDLLIDIARREAVDLVVVGPEAPLAIGLADACLAVGIPVFGPTQAAARLESSKAFAKEIMQAAGVFTAEAQVFSDPAEAAEFARASGHAWVIKADGLASGKGVIVPDTLEETLAAIEQIAATGAGSTLLLEQRLSGPEVSVIALCDGERLLVLPPAQDHKRLLNNDEGPNTGGMGAFAPSHRLGEDTLSQIVEHTMLPVVRELAARGTPFRGALYAGMMLTPDGPAVIEFNARFGDPETQVLMPLIEGDLLAALYASATGTLEPSMLSWRRGAAACVVLAAAGYPEAPRRGDAIRGLEAVEEASTIVFHAGTDRVDGQIVVSGGRVLGVTSAGRSLDEALQHVYSTIDGLEFDGMQYRTDIGKN